MSDKIPAGQGVRFNGVKYMFASTQDKMDLIAKVTEPDGSEAAYTIKLDRVHVLKKGPQGLLIAAKQGVFFAVLHDTSNPKMAQSAALSAMAIGFYWAIGGD